MTILVIAFAVGCLVGSFFHPYEWWKARREETTRLDKMYGPLFGVERLKGESNNAFRARMKQRMNEPLSRPRGVPAWLANLAGRAPNESNPTDGSNG